MHWILHQPIEKLFSIFEITIFSANWKEKSVEYAIQYIVAAVILHYFLITENNEGNYLFQNEDKFNSNLYAVNELNFPINDVIDKNANHFNTYFLVLI